MKKIIIPVYLLGIILVFYGMSFSSCKKPKGPKGIVTVLDSLGRPVEGAVVIVQPDTKITSYIKDVKITDKNGQTFHEYDTEYILNLRVAKHYIIMEGTNCYILKYESPGILILEMDKTYEETIQLYKGIKDKCQ